MDVLVHQRPGTLSRARAGWLGTGIHSLVAPVEVSTNGGPVLPIGDSKGEVLGGLQRWYSFDPPQATQ